MGQLGWAGGLSGFGKGIRSGYDMMTAMQDRERALAAESAFGDTLRAMYGPQPGQATGAPTQLQMPGAQPMPAMMRPPASQPGMPQRPMMAGSAPPMSAPQPGAPPPSQAMQPLNDFGDGPSSAPLPNSPEAPMQRAQPQLTWQNVLTELSKRMPPGTDPGTIARVADKLLPIMNSQSQAEWREMSGRIKMLEQGRKTDQGDRRLDQGDRRLDQGDATASENRRVHDARIKKIDTDIKKASSKLPAETKAMLDVHRNYYNQAATTLRVAQTNLQRAQWEGSPENKAAAQQDVTEAEAAVKAAQSQLDSFVAKVLPGTKLNFEDGPAAAPAAAPKAAAKTPAPAGNAQFAKTKGGATAQVSGYESPQYMPQTKPPGTKPATMSTPAPAAKTPVVSAQPSASTKAIPLPKSKAMLVKGQLYDTRFGPATWNGTSFVSAKNGTKAK